MDLKDFFKEYKKVAVALSGGIDSAYLLYVAKACGAEVSAYFVKSDFVPSFEMEDALSVAEKIGVDVKVLHTSVLKCDNITSNGEDRCYYCKKHMFEKILEVAKTDGLKVVIEGTNASDDISDRPGFRAIGEMGVLSPLRICGLTKEEVRRLSNEAGIFLWNKPSYSCLATRIAKNEKITEEKLALIETAEKFLFDEGFSDFRVRVHCENMARLELNVKDKALFENKRPRILEELCKYFTSVTFDLEARR